MFHNVLQKKLPRCFIMLNRTNWRAFTEQIKLACCFRMLLGRDQTGMIFRISTLQYRQSCFFGVFFFFCLLNKLSWCFSMLSRSARVGKVPGLQTGVVSRTIQSLGFCQVPGFLRDVQTWVSLVFLQFYFLSLHDVDYVFLAPAKHELSSSDARLSAGCANVG